ncbi:MAG: hypothetical protein FD126_3279, partial [Elusimicrobia bacterium]
MKRNAIFPRPNQPLTGSTGFGASAEGLEVGSGASSEVTLLAGAADSIESDIPSEEVLRTRGCGGACGAEEARPTPMRRARPVRAALSGLKLERKPPRAAGSEVGAPGLKPPVTPLAGVKSASPLSPKAARRAEKWRPS